VTEGAQKTIRLDKWLWFARFFKTRTLSAKCVSGGHVRVNSTKVSKPSAMIGAGDTLTFAQGDRVRVVRLLNVGKRRGPAPEAQALFDDLTPPEEPASVAPAYPRKGARPTKKDRRALDRLGLHDAAP